MVVTRQKVYRFFVHHGVQRSFVLESRQQFLHRPRVEKRTRKTMLSGLTRFLKHVDIFFAERGFRMARVVIVDQLRKPQRGGHARRPTADDNNISRHLGMLNVGEGLAEDQHLAVGLWLLTLLSSAENMIRERHPRRIVCRTSPFLKDHRHGTYDQRKGCIVVPLQGLMKIQDGKDREYRQSNYFLNSLQLRHAKFVRAYAVGRHLKTIFRKRDQPAQDDDLQQRRAAILQMTIPGKGHKNVGEGQEQNGRHADICCVIPRCSCSRQSGPCGSRDGERGSVPLRSVHLRAESLRERFANGRQHLVHLRRPPYCDPHTSFAAWARREIANQETAPFH